MYFGGTMPKLPRVRISWISGEGFCVMMRTVCSSTTSTDLIHVKFPRMGDFCSGLSTRSKENLTASALKGSPLWKETPRRSFSSQVRGSMPLTDSARCGAGFHVLVSRVSSVSNRCWLMMMPIRAVCMWGSCVGVSEPRATVTWPFGCAPAGTTATTRASATSATIRSMALLPCRPRRSGRGRGDLEQCGGGGADAVQEAIHRGGLVRGVVGLVVRGVRHPDARHAEDLREQPVGDGAPEVGQHDGRSAPGLRDGPDH